MFSLKRKCGTLLLQVMRYTQEYSGEEIIMLVKIAWGKNVKNIVCCACMVTSVLIAGCSQEHASNVPLRSTSISTGVLGTTTVLATIAVDENIVVQGQEGAPAGLASVIFSEKGGGVAYIEGQGDRFRVVHNGRRGRWFSRIEGLVLSPDGSRAAYVAPAGKKWCVVVDGKEGTAFDNVGIPRFSPDGKHVVYNVTDKGAGRHVVDSEVSNPFPSSWDQMFSGDSKKVIVIENSATQDTLHRVVVYDPPFRNRREKELDAVLFVFNRERDRIAAIGLEQGKKRMIELATDNLESVKKGPFHEDIFDHGFGPDGVSIAYMAKDGTTFKLVLNGKESVLPIISRADIPVIRPDGNAAGIILADKKGYYLYQVFAAQSSRTGKRHQEAGMLAYSADGKSAVYVARKDKKYFPVINGKEGAAFDMIVDPMFSPDGKYIVFRARENQKRFIVIADLSGREIKRGAQYELVFPPLFTDDGRSIAYGAKDGLNLIWKVESLP